MLFGATRAALASAGFVKAFIYSVVSAIVGVIIVFLADPEVAGTFGKWAFMIPLANSVFVFIKQYADEKAKRGE